MDKRIAKMKNHVIICGYGRIGGAISQELDAMGVECVIIDRDEARKTGAQVNRFPSIGGNATSDSTLLNAGVDRAAILVAALSNDSDNLFVALAARDLNPNLVVIARGEDKSIETRMLRAGVDRVVYPAQLGGGQIARLVGAELGHDPDRDRNRRITDVMGFDLQVHRNFKPKSVTVAEILECSGAMEVVAHIDAEGVRHRNPGPQDKVAQGEVVVLLREVAGARDADKDALDAVAIRQLDLDIPAIDEEHAEIFRLIAPLHDAATAGNPEALQAAATALHDYAAKHFHHEEQLMWSAEFPEAEQHAALHAALLAELEGISREGVHDGGGDLGYRLESWFQDHILLEDRKYAAHMTTVRS